MDSSRSLRFWLACAVSPGAVLEAQTASSDSLYQAPYPCADTSLTRWLSADTAVDGHRVNARALYEHVLARTHAPILRFAPSERYFPTIPFWTAFLPSAGALTPHTRPPRAKRYIDPTKQFWTALPRDSETPAIPLVSVVRQAYDDALDRSAAPHKLKPPLPVVFYRVCDLIAPDLDAFGRPDTRNDPRAAASEPRRWEDKAVHLWNYLRSDEQAWHRFGLNGEKFQQGGRQGDSLIRQVKQFHVIQYFVYYLQDWGLAGHSEDIEYTFVFVPKDPVAARSFRVVVGAGHDPPAANNVLVLVKSDASKERYYHPNILVELGGHSSAPDMPPFGQFSAGLDVNWHIGDLWGTRDEQATAGLSYSGRYEGAMTYPRDQQDAVTLFPSGFGAGADSGRQMLADLVRVSPDYLAERAHQASDQARHLPKPVSAERRALAETILTVYGAALETAERESRHAIGTSDSLDAVIQSKYVAQVDDTSPQPEYFGARASDRATREANLREIRRERARQARHGVDSVLRRARCKDSAGAPSQADCPPWPPDIERSGVVGDLVGLLESTNKRIPPDSIMTQLLAIVPDPDSTPSAMDAIASEIRRVVIERLQPEYSLLPVRYLQAVYQGAVASDTEGVRRHLKLITRMLHPATCDELACGLSVLRDTLFNSEFDAVVCGLWGKRTPPRGTVPWPKSLACQFNPSHLDSIRLWNKDVYDLRTDGFGQSRRWPAAKHKIWQHALYSRPELIFRTGLFRPTALQVTNSRRAFEGLLHTGYTLLSGRASHPYVGIVVPAFHSLNVPVKVPGYLAVQVGPYLGWPYENRATTLGLGVLYDRQFAYFYGLYLKAHWANNRSAAEAGSGASDFAWSFGASLWAPFMQTLHLRAGLRFDTDGIRPLFDRTVWDLQLEFRR